jgi:hypothetical protein
MSEAGYEVTTFHSASKAIKLYKQRYPSDKNHSFTYDDTQSPSVPNFCAVYQK